MPLFDGTGLMGSGPMTGQGEGYCALVLPPLGSQESPYGYAGLAGRPVHLGACRHPMLGASIVCVCRERIPFLTWGRSSPVPPVRRCHRRPLRPILR